MGQRGTQVNYTTLDHFRGARAPLSWIRHCFRFLLLPFLYLLGKITFLGISFLRNILSPFSLLNFHESAILQENPLLRKSCFLFYNSLMLFLITFSSLLLFPYIILLFTAALFIFIHYFFIFNV